MNNGNFDVTSNENYEQFVQRASGIFPVERVRNWSRVERAVFNHLMARLINQKSYCAITDAMLEECRDEMNKIVCRCDHF